MSFLWDGNPAAVLMRHCSFESWFATCANSLPTPGLLQRLERLPGSEYSVSSTS